MVLKGHKHFDPTRLNETAMGKNATFWPFETVLTGQSDGFKWPKQSPAIFLTANKIKRSRTAKKCWSADARFRQLSHHRLLAFCLDDPTLKNFILPKSTS